MDELELLIDLHVRNDRQGPGCDEATRRAIELARLEPSPELRIADLGCGTGASALVLAGELRAHVTAVDAAPALVERLRARADQEGLGGQVHAQVGDIESPDFGDRHFDVVWSEGAIYNIGFEAGARNWSRLLKPGGILAVTELSWTTAQRPDEVERHWRDEYPGIATPSAKLGMLERLGYEPMAMFFLPGHCWTKNYYQPLAAGFSTFLDRHGNSPQARALVEAERSEIALFERFGRWYGYAFYIARWSP